MKKSFSGFILLEVCIALMVFGMVSWSIYPLLKTFEKQKQTEHLEKLAYVLAGFVTKHGRLPCPGTEVETTPCTSEGPLPYKTLEIPQTWVKDSSGRPILYKVNSFLSLPGLQIDYRFKSLQGDHQTFCYTPLEHSALKTSDHIPIAFQLDNTIYPREPFLRFYMKWTCQRK